MTQFEMDVGNKCNWRPRDAYSDEVMWFIELDEWSKDRGLYRGSFVRQKLLILIIWLFFNLKLAKFAYADIICVICVDKNKL